MRGPGMPNFNGEKVEMHVWKKLFNYCRKYIALIIIAVICSIAGTVFTVIGPDKLSEMTDTISEGIIPKTDKIESVTDKMQDNMKTNMETLVKSIQENFQNADMKTKAKEIMTSEDVPAEDKKAFQAFMQNMQKQRAAALKAGNKAQGAEQSEEAQMKSMQAVFNLPESVLNKLYDTIEVNGETLSVKDQTDTLKILTSVDKDDENAAQEAMKNLPEAAMNSLYSDMEIDGINISKQDQRDMIETMKNMDTDEDQEKALETLDSLPESVKELIEPSVDLGRIKTIGFILLAFYAAGVILSTIQGWIMSGVTQKICKSLRTNISEKINRLPMAYYQKHTTGDILSRVTNDVDLIGTTLNMSVGNLIHAAALFAGSLIMMFTTNVIMTVTAILSTILGFALMGLIMKNSQKYFREQQESLGSLNGHIEEIYAGHTVVKAYNGEEKAVKEFDKLNESLRKSGFLAQALSGLMMPIMTFIGNFGYVAVCIAGAYLVMNDKITFGVIVSFMIYIRLFTQPLAQIAQASQQLLQAGAASARVFDFLDAEEMEDESHKEKCDFKAEGNVEFNHVKFGYDKDKVIIKDFSADVKKGQKIAIVGPTGAGKSTLINLLMRFYETNSGSIKIDGHKTTDLTREEVHSQFCMVLQDTWIFEGTLRENLIYCSENKSDEVMERACKAVGIDHFIKTLPHGYDTVLNDNVSLSQGQKQQITIARAMIADKPILILDEATSSIDTRTELKIQKAMDQLMKGRTSFVIAHRLSTIKDADLILVLKDGDVIESGNHEELMNQNGFYADLYNSQFESAS